MRGWISIVAVSAVLAAGLVTGRAAADSTTMAPSATTTWSDPPAKPVTAAPVIKTDASRGPACTANAFSLASACNAQGRAVRVIALTQR